MPDAAPVTKASESIAVKRCDEIEALRAYFDKHRVSTTIEDIINTVGQEKPTDCYGIMVQMEWSVVMWLIAYKVKHLSTLSAPAVIKKATIRERTDAWGNPAIGVSFQCHYQGQTHDWATVVVPVISQALEEPSLLSEQIKKALADKYGVNLLGRPQTRTVVSSGPKPDLIYQEFKKALDNAAPVIAQFLKEKPLTGQAEFDQDLKMNVAGIDQGNYFVSSILRACSLTAALCHARQTGVSPRQFFHSLTNTTPDMITILLQKLPTFISSIPAEGAGGKGAKPAKATEASALQLSESGSIILPASLYSFDELLVFVHDLIKTATSELAGKVSGSMESLVSGFSKVRMGVSFDKDMIALDAEGKMEWKGTKLTQEGWCDYLIGLRQKIPLLSLFENVNLVEQAMSSKLVNATTEDQTTITSLIKLNNQLTVSDVGLKITDDNMFSAAIPLCEPNSPEIIQIILGHNIQFIVLGQASKGDLYRAYNELSLIQDV